MSCPHNIRKISDTVNQFIVSSKAEDFMIFAQKSLLKNHISSGKYLHLGISMNQDNEVSFTKMLLPDKNNGRFCKKNQEGEVIVHKEMGLKERIRYMDVPNFGDYSYGTHEVGIPIRYYPKEYISPYFIQIQIEKIDETENDVIFRFSSNEILSKKDKNFEKRLFSNANIFQELFGTYSIKESNTPYPSYRKQISIDWELLPEGERLQHIQSFITKNPSNNESQKKEILDRFKFLESFNPESTIIGTSGINRYIGYQFSEKIVVFENLSYGNAIYIMYDNWKNLSQRSRVDLLSGVYGTDFDRIVHNKHWKIHLRSLLKRNGIKRINN